MRLHSLCSKLCKQILFSPPFGQCKKLHSYSSYDRSFMTHFKFFQIPNLYEVNSVGFHLTTKLRVKSYQEKENEYAHSIMETHSAYDKSIIRQPVEVNAQESSRLPKELTEFEKVTIQCVSQNISLEDKSLSLLVSDIVKIIPTLSDENLIHCLHLLCCWPPTRKTWTPNFKAIWNCLDYECVERLQTWDTQRKLLVADYWFQLRLNRISQYNRNMIENMLQNLDQLTDTEMVQLMFYINLQREVPANSLGTLETRLLSTVKSISMDELGIICLGFFKTKNKIGDISIIKAIIERFLNEIENAQQVTIVALLKFLKKSMLLPYTESYIPLLHKCVPYIPTWEIKTCIHSALLASECHVYHPLLLNAVIERATCEIENARMKDCMKLLQCLSHFNHPPSQKFNQLLLCEIKKESRKIEISDHPRDLIYFALYYSYMGIFSNELLNIVLDQNFAERCVAMFPETSLTFAEVDCSVEIECKNYGGRRLGRNSWQVLQKRRGNIAFVPEKSNTLTRLANEIIHSLEEMLGNRESIILKHVLPHVFSPDIIVQLSGDPKSLSFCSEQLFVPPQNELWASIVIGTPFSFTYRSKHMTGVTAMKLRQLEKLGYKTIFIPYFELPRDSELRKKFLKQKLETPNKYSSYNLSMKLK